MKSAWMVATRATTATAAVDAMHDGKLFRMGETVELRPGDRVPHHFSGPHLYPLTDLEEAGVENTRLQGVITDLQAKLADRETKAASLEGELADARARLEVVSLERLRVELGRLSEEITKLIPAEPAEAPKKGFLGRFRK